MRIGILFSGGKDSAAAIEWALKNGHTIEWLLSVKPSRKDCYLFHYATVEHTPTVAQALKLPHELIGCDVADPAAEAELIRKTMQGLSNVEALVLGGVGLQETQLASLQNALKPHSVKVFAAHQKQDHELVLRDLVNRGYLILITQVAADGLLPWLGKEITAANVDALVRDSKKFGFHVGFEGGHADTLVLDAPFFPARIVPEKVELVVEDAYCGHVEIKKLKIEKKQQAVEIKAAF